MKRPRNQAVKWILLSATLVAVSWLGGVRLFAFSGRSMEPAVMPGDYFVGLVGALGPHSLKRFDLVIFDVPPTSKWAGKRIPWMKRLVGLPGEHVRLEGSRLFINGRAVDAPFLHRETSASASLEFDLLLSADDYCVLGDNLDHALEDSRVLGPISKSLLRGRILFVLRGPANRSANEKRERTSTMLPSRTEAGIEPRSGGRTR